MLRIKRFSKSCHELNEALDENILSRIWLRHVRNDLRKQALCDLHDYYDFHILHRQKIKQIRYKILDGSYQPSHPLRIGKEKGKGISRQIVVISPEDALVIEALGQYLYAFVIENQASKNAFFSRKHSNLPSVDSFDSASPYNWWELWPIFQEKICNFSKKNNYIVSTDISNYYDHVSFSSLRNSISSIGKFSEGFLDFLFFVIERFVWRPDYLPHPGKGIAQMNLEAPRVLAHAFLFSIDQYLKEETGENFVRWMDDIDFGCDNVDKAKSILRELDDLLLSKGLHLNSSKTRIMDGEEANGHFHFTENRYLSALEKNIDKKILAKKFTAREQSLLRYRYYRFISNHDRSNTEKIIKRYFTLFGKIKCNHLECECEKVLKDVPGLRESVFRYFVTLGWSPTRQRILEDYLLQSQDDDSLLRATRVLTEWIPSNSTKFCISMRTLGRALESKVTKKKKLDLVRLLCLLWLYAKFFSQNELQKFIVKHADVWRTRWWLARQFAAVFPLIDDNHKNIMMNIIHANGLTDARSVLDSYQYLSSGTRGITRKVLPYIKAFNTNGTYPFYKVLIARAFIHGTAARGIIDSFSTFINKNVRDMRSRQLMKN